MSRGKMIFEKPLLGRNLEEIISLVQKAGVEAYRGRQLFKWIYECGETDFARMTDLQLGFRDLLTKRFVVTEVRLKDKETDDQGTSKLLFTLGDGQHIESVIMREKKRWTLCVSTQVGCPLECAFCLTGKSGFVRNLSVDEILAQPLLAHKLLGENEKIGNVVLMGMGEPLLNVENVIAALRLLTSPQAMAVSNRRVTLSTVGIVPGMEQLGRANLNINLAISLNAPTDELRSTFMPVNRKYPIAEVLKAARQFPLTNRRRITFEYVLLKGRNDSVAHANKLRALLHGIRCKVNLIMLNPDTRISFEPTDSASLERFREVLLNGGYTVAVRYSKGADIHAACGQLAAHANLVS